MVVSAVKCDVFSRLTKDFGDRQLPHDATVVNTSRDEPRTKSVHFADTKGLALTSISFFAKDNLSPPRTRKKIITYFKDNKRRDNDGQPVKFLNFKSHLSYEDVLGRLETQNVCLEKIFCNTFGIYGRIQVKNLDFEKLVRVRFTFDAWQSWRDLQANYIPGSSSGQTDSFFFHLRSPELTSEHRKMEFAISYKVCEQEFWDNNHGDNYRLVYFKSN